MDKRILIPKSVVERLHIKQKELYEVELKIFEDTFHETVLIYKNDRSNRSDEYSFIIRTLEIPTKTKAKIKFIKKVEQIAPDRSKSLEHTIFIPNFISNPRINYNS